MGIVLRRREFCMVVGILTTLFCSGRSQVIIAAPCNNGTIRGCHVEDELLVDTTEISIYEAVEFVMDSEISRRILRTIPYNPLKRGTAKPAPQHGNYTRPCTNANKCRLGAARPGTAKPAPQRGKPYTRPCTYGTKCRGEGTAKPAPQRGKPYTRGCTYAQHCRG